MSTAATVDTHLIPHTANHLLERALIEKLHRRADTMGSLGELATLAVRLGLLQNTLKPRLRDPQLVIFAADHGLAVEGLGVPLQRGTHEQVLQLLRGQLPLAVFARIQQVGLTVVDCGMAEKLPRHESLLQRKMAHGTRNARRSLAMSREQAHAGIRAGMEIGDTLAGNALLCAGIGLGSNESAALVLARAADLPVAELLRAGPQMSEEHLNHLLGIAQGAQQRHRDSSDPVEILCAFGGFEMAVMIGVILVAASKRHLLVIDGLAACAALLLASRMAPAVTDYCVFCRSHSHQGLDQALALFKSTALLELGMESLDGTGATLAWPMLRSAAALLTELAEGEEPGPTLPAPLAGGGALPGPGHLA